MQQFLLCRVGLWPAGCGASGSAGNRILRERADQRFSNSLLKMRIAGPNGANSGCRRGCGNSQLCPKRLQSRVVEGGSHHLEWIAEVECPVKPDRGLFLESLSACVTSQGIADQRVIRETLQNGKKHIVSFTRPVQLVEGHREIEPAKRTVRGEVCQGPADQHGFCPFVCNGAKSILDFQHIRVGAHNWPDFIQLSSSFAPIPKTDPALRGRQVMRVGRFQ